MMAVLVCISTLTTKQHVIVDAAGGIFLAELCLRLGRSRVVYRTYEKLTDRINGMIFGDRGEDDHAEQKESAV